MQKAFGIHCRTLFLHKPTTAQMKTHLLLLLALVLATACVSPNQPIRLQGTAQGTYYSIAYLDPQNRDLQPQIDSLLNDFDLTASLWVENSLIRRVNRQEKVCPNAIFEKLLSQSLLIEEYTQGAFNCKIGSLVNLYGFGFKNREDITPQQIDSLLNLIHHGECTISGTPPTVILSEGIELDFNAIAQGYAVDLLAAMLESYGINNYLIDVGGEVIAKGTKNDGNSWTVGIERPAENKYSSPEIETAIMLSNQAIVTSGNYRKYYEKDGVRYSHTIDPNTGRPVNHSLLSVSVVSSTATYADAMATAFMVMGLEKSLQFIHDHPENPDIQAVFFIYDNHGNYKTHATPEFKKLIK